MSVKPRVAVLISGRGSNMQALLEAAKAPDYPAEIVLVLSNKPEAAGLETARGFGVIALAVPAKPFGRDREAHERALDAVLRSRTSPSSASPAICASSHPGWSIAGPGGC